MPDAAGLGPRLGPAGEPEGPHGPPWVPKRRWVAATLVSSRFPPSKGGGAYCCCYCQWPRPLKMGLGPRPPRELAATAARPARLAEAAAGAASIEVEAPGRGRGGPGPRGGEVQHLSPGHPGTSLRGRRATVTMSTLAYYRTSRLGSLQFPLASGVVCPLSGTQLEPAGRGFGPAGAVSWKSPVERMAVGCLLFRVLSIY
jgi:hypothetical protein